MRRILPFLLAAGTAVLKLMLASGATNVIVVDDKGAIYRGRPGLNESLAWIAEQAGRWPRGSCRFWQDVLPPM